MVVGGGGGRAGQERARAGRATDTHTTTRDTTPKMDKSFAYKMKQRTQQQDAQYKKKKKKNDKYILRFEKYDLLKPVVVKI
jgi:hypothetical protein